MEVGGVIETCGILGMFGVGISLTQTDGESSYPVSGSKSQDYHFIKQTCRMSPSDDSAAPLASCPGSRPG